MLLAEKNAFSVYSLEEKKYIERVNGKRFGYWKVNIE
jgi:hypothetical protein